MQPTTQPIPSLRGSESRFWSKVDKSAGPDGCWPWTASLNTKGYGQFMMGKRPNKRPRPSHRLAYADQYGQPPPGAVIDHLCHNPVCVNPAHLQAVTTKVNNENRRGANKNSHSRVRGVSRHKDGKWAVWVGHERKNYYGGIYSTLADAEKAAVALRNTLYNPMKGEHNEPSRG